MAMLPQSELSLSVKQFFDEVCPKVLEVQAEEAKQLGGSLGFRIFGEETGAWLVDLNKATVESRLAPEADAFLEMNDAALIGMLKGTLDLEAAVKDGQMRYQGDLEVLVKLGALLGME